MCKLLCGLTDKQKYRKALISSLNEDTEFAGYWNFSVTGNLVTCCTNILQYSHNIGTIQIQRSRLSRGSSLYVFIQYYN